jgi:SAM-dependent methyltransferase
MYRETKEAKIMPTPNHEQIYEIQADLYELLISKQPSLYDVIQDIVPTKGLDILDLGAGTGRLTSILAPEANSMTALDESEAMLGITVRKLRNADLHNWTVRVADHRALPVADHSADLVVSGWSLCYLCSSNIPNWYDNFRKIMTEIRRVLRHGGMVVIFETGGTGSETPVPPDFLTGYFKLLESDYGFSHRWIRTDYTFEDPFEAERLTRFFFGDQLADHIADRRLTYVPECAGVWWLRV